MSLRYIALFVVSTLLLSSHSIAQDNDDNEQISDDPIIIHLDIADGQSTSVDVIVSGYLENEEAPTAVWWELSDSHGIRSSGMLTSSISESSGDFVRPRWTFQFTVLSENVIPCSCNLIVFAQEESMEPVKQIRSIFFGVVADSLPPTIYVYQDIIDDWNSNSMLIYGKSLSIGGSTPEIGVIIEQSTDVRCNSEIQNSYAESFNIEQESIDWKENGDFSFSVDVGGFTDGWYDITVFSELQDTAGYAYFCISTRVDNHSPTPVITGPIALNEGIGSLTLDCSGTTDDYWGISGITYIWAVKEITPMGLIPVELTTGQSTRDISLNLTSSGIFDVSLTVVDMAGNSAYTSLTVEISNIQPVVRLQVGGLDVYDGDDVVIRRDNAIMVDASSSTDTENDIGSLRYIWRINNVPTYEGAQRELDWPDSDSGFFYLTLEVIDDDSASSILTIRVSDSDESFSIPSSLVVFIAASVFLSYAIYNHRRDIDPNEDIPKWT